ncbi:RNA polymerase sigma-70 factor, ECF subfamily [Paracidovorax konjaci]|uniref:RNA polymerase sigma-70 factor, ECF subfamily n=1 Tax=Paracidovorax konjaci TaxID=32040 RepID=A0A1I1RFN6_9BURK|nr:sigma-70 family RNA polymerase sigma factor [Paracidovorax konjaci]SFD33099.1 RNA polymerase sigma-70 factor, ECF subfamily [Paracidovorax konjaci]
MVYASSPIDAAPAPAAGQDLGRLYGDHHGWLQGWLRRRLGCPDQAADLAQDTFLRLLSHRLRGGAAEAPAPREPRAFLATVAGRLVANHFRRLSLERAWLDALASLPPADWPSAEQHAIAREALHRLDAALAGLAERVRRAFLLSQLEGRDYAAIATELGVTERSVKRYMVQAFEACILAAD